MRASHTLENIEEDDRDRQDPDRRRKGSGGATAKRRDATGVKFSRVKKRRDLLQLSALHSFDRYIQKL